MLACILQFQGLSASPLICLLGIDLHLFLAPLSLLLSVSTFTYIKFLWNNK